MSELRERLAQLTPEQRSQLEARLRARSHGNGRIGPRPPDAEPRLSFGQERVWRLCRLLGDSAAYNICSAHRVRGPLDVETLRAAMEAVVAQHEQLRTVISRDDGRPLTTLPGRFELDVVDLTTDADPLARVADWVARPLDISDPPLFTARLWRLGAEHHLFAMLAHHLVCDGWSMSIIEAQLSEAYGGETVHIDRPTIDYADFVEWERSREESLRSRLDYWRSSLDGVPALRLPGERSTQSGEVSVELPVAVSAAIDELARRARATPFTVFLAVFAATLKRHTAQHDLVVCTPVAGRPDPALEHVVGYFNDLVPILGRLSDDSDLLGIIDRYRPAVLGALEQSVPFQWIAGLRETSSTPLTRALFALNDVPATGLTLPRLTVKPVHLPVAESDFELGWFMRSEGDRYRATVCYRSLPTETVERLATDFVALAEAFAGDPRTKISDLPNRAPSLPAATARSVATQPRSLLESRLQRIWERIFSRPVGVDDDFFDLGGHSLLAAELIAEIERELAGERIPLATLFRAPTVARQARLLDEGGWRESWASLVPIKPSGDRVPLFFVHGQGGNVIGFSDLARNLSAEQPFYGLQAPGMDADRGPRRIEEMARTYVEEIRTVQPTGTYLVGGWCLGGDVAFEMAQQLCDSGAEVALVLMVDNPRPDHIGTAPSSGLRRVRNQAGTRIVKEWSNLVELPWRDRGGYVVARTGELARHFGSAVEQRATDDDGTLPFGLQHSRTYRQDELATLHEKAYQGYSPRPYSGTVAILRAERQPFGRRPDPSLGWAPLVNGRLLLHSLPGHRLGLLSEPRVRRVAPVIERAIRTALDLDEVDPS